MIEKKVVRAKLKRIVKMSLVSGTISGLVMVLAVSLGTPASATLALVAQSFVSSFLIGFSIPLIVFGVRDFVFARRVFRRLSYLLYVVLTVLLLVAATWLAFVAIGMIFFPEAVFDASNLFYTMCFSSGMAVLFSFFDSLNRFLGKSFLVKMISGKYHRAKNEVLILLFIDLRSSTTFGETLTPPEFFDLLNDFMLVVEQCCHLHEGVIYKYMGDGAIVAWDARRISYKHALQAILEIRDEIGRKERCFAEKYGRPVEFTAGIHAGQVLIGELGDERKEIGYWGDTINTTERIQSSCKEYGVSILLSEDFYSSVSGHFPELVRDLRTERVEGAILRGKAQGLNLIKVIE